MTSRANQSWPSDHYAAEIDADTIQSESESIRQAAYVIRDRMSLVHSADAWHSLKSAHDYLWAQFDSMQAVR